MNEPVRQPVYVFEGFRLDAQRRVLFGIGGHSITLTPRLFDTLLYFVERSGQLLTKGQLLDALWPNVVVEEHNLNKTVSELRRLLGETPGEHRFIVTKPGRGYRFVADVSVASNAAAALRPDAADADDTDAAFALPLTALQPPTPRATSHRAYWAAAAAGAGALAVAVAMFGLLGPASEPPLRTTPWSMKKGGQWSPVWSPEGEATAFVTLGSATEPAELHIRALNEPVARSIASRSRLFPAITQWTTDGRILFFERDGLWSVSPVGALPEQAVAFDYQALGIAVPIRTAHVTRDGASLAAVARGEDGSYGIWIATPPSATLERYEPAPFAATYYNNVPFLRFSPDGKHLLLIWHAADRGDEAWLIPFPADMSNPPRRVLESLPMEGAVAEFSWLPDNRHVVVSAGPQQRWLYVADTQSGRFRTLTTGLNAFRDPMISPDGSRLLFTDLKPDSDIVTLDLETGALTDLIATDRSEFLPSWATAANALVYASNRSGEGEIWLRQLPRPDRPLVTARDFAGATLYLLAPTLSPDASKVAYYRVDKAEADGTRVWMSRVDGGTPERLTNEEVQESAGSWSPDGVWYAYYANPGDSRSLKRVKTTGRATPETLLEGLPRSGELAPIWSPDGQWLLVPHRTMTLVSADGTGTTRNLGIGPAPCAFAKGEALLYCIRGTDAMTDDHVLVELDLRGEGERIIRRVPLADIPIEPFGPGLRLSPTPGGLGVTFSVNRTSQNIWLMEGLDEVELP